MNIRVMRRDGLYEIIAVVGPVEIHHGTGMDHLHSADGMDYYFLHDGTYDGWGKSAPAGMTMDEAAQDIERIERERHIDDPREPRSQG